MILIFIPILLLGDIYYVIFSSILGIMALWELERLEKDIPNYMKLLSYFISLFLILYNYKDTNYSNMFNYPVIGGMFLLSALSLIINGNLSKQNYHQKSNIILIKK